MNTDSARRIVVVPDTDGELTMWLSRLEDLLIAVSPFDEGWEPPAPPLGDGSALDAHRRIFSSVLAAEHAPAVTVVGPDRRLELVPIHLVPIDRTDLCIVTQALDAFGRATLPGGDDLVAGVLADLAAAHRVTVTELIAECARAHGLLDLTSDDDTDRLARRLETATARVVLDVEDLNAYRRFTDRVISLFHSGDTLFRYLYRG